MKPGDLVQIINVQGCYDYFPPKLGLIIGPMPTWTNTRFPVLSDGEILYVPDFELRMIEETDETG
jgi:hypothetical protein